MANNLPFAEDINYWQTGRSAPDIWIDRTRSQLEELGGKILMEAFGRDGSGRGAYMLSFEIQGERFKIVWPVLPTRSGNEKAARIQAATMIYHDVKARAIAAAVIGARSAFFSYWLLPDGRSMMELSNEDLFEAVPRIQLQPGGDDIIEGEYQ